MRHSTLTALIAAAVACAVHAPGAARAPAAEKAKRAAVLQAVTDCRTLTGDAERLACYDRSVAKLDAAEASNDVMVVDRQQVREGRRQLFGLTLPNFAMFRGGDEKDEVQEIDTVATAVRTDAEGRWLITLEDGAVWRQISDARFGRPPRPGSRISIRNAALGSFFLKIDGQTAIRARRVQ